MTGRNLLLMRAFLRLHENEQLELYVKIKEYVEAIDLIKKLNVKEKILLDVETARLEDLRCPVCHES